MKLLGVLCCMVVVGMMSMFFSVLSCRCMLMNWLGKRLLFLLLNSVLILMVLVFVLMVLLVLVMCFLVSICLCLWF